MKYRTPPQWVYYLLAAPFMKPAIFGVLAGSDWIETLFDVWRLGAAAVICLLYLRQMGKLRRPPSVVTALLLVYLGFVALATLVRENNLWSLINYTVTIAVFCLLVELRLREDPVEAVDMLVMPMTVLVLVNLSLQILYPWGLWIGGTYGYAYHFMGIDNLLAPQLIPYMFLVVLRSSLLHGRINWFAYIMVAVAAESLLVVWSSTALVGLAVALVFLLFFYERRWQTLFNFLTAGTLGAGMFFGIVIFRLQDVFAFVIEGVFHKGLSFTGRTEIWDRAIEMFLQSPYLGYGIAQSGKVYRLRRAKYYHAHNMFLEVLVEGGLPALLAWLFLWERAGRQLLIHRKHPYACLLSAGLMAVLLMATMEPFLDQNGLMIYAMLFFSYYVGDLIAAEPGEQAPLGAAMEDTGTLQDCI